MPYIIFMSNISSNTSLANAIFEVDEVNQRLASIDILQGAGRSALAAYVSVGADLMVGVSAGGQAIVTAALLTADGIINVFGPRASPSIAIIVESATVTGRMVIEMADRLRQDGAQSVFAAVMHRARPDLDQLDSDPAIDRVIELVAI
jgi:hypothetical protein